MTVDAVYVQETTVQNITKNETRKKTRSYPEKLPRKLLKMSEDQPSMISHVARRKSKERKEEK